MTEAGGDSGTDLDSELDDSLQGIIKRDSFKEGQEMFGEYAFRKDKIFKYITIQDKNISIPNLSSEDSNKLTIFMDIDDILLHTFICDENFGYIANPASKIPEHEFLLEDIRQPVLVYMRDHWEDFISYLKEN